MGNPKFKLVEKRKEPTVNPPADQEDNGSFPYHGTIVNSPFVSIHEYASDTAPVKDYLSEGEVVEIQGESSGFYIIRYCDHTKRLGFVNHNFLRRCKNE